MEKKLEILQEAIKKEVEIRKEKNKELCLLGLMTEEDIARMNAIIDRTVNEINKVYIEFFEMNTKDA